MNGQNEMAAAFMLAGFDANRCHMQDLLIIQTYLSEFQGLAACGGFSYGDVLGAGGGWSSSISLIMLLEIHLRAFLIVVKHLLLEFVMDARCYLI